MMFQRWLPTLLLGGLALGACMVVARPAHAQGFDPNRFTHYPYYFFPHNYWPSQGPQWPEPVGSPYRPAPAYMSLPPFREPNWRYEWWEPQRYYSGTHFLLDQF
ncbi:MAG TPA: hypothetical protein VK395_11225 [Gemmataceae bacterium]|nr:hypothetical protein [Gemmataceae bacterium]